MAIAGSSSKSREIVGRAALLAYLEEITSNTGGSFILEDRADTFSAKLD